ncbi:hypothetical protein AN1V17_51720 [Vallitalea sediminicola]
MRQSERREHPKRYITLHHSLQGSSLRSFNDLSIPNCDFAYIILYI